MLGGEHLLEGWAAYAGQSGGSVLGLVLLTDQRVIFVDAGAGMTAFPISKISSVEVTAPCAVTFTAWYGTLVLTFDNPGILAAMLNLVRQDPAWTARETLFGQPSHRSVGVSLAQTVGDGAGSPERDARVGADRRDAAIAPLEAA